MNHHTKKRRRLVPKGGLLSPKKKKVVAKRKPTNNKRKKVDSESEESEDESSDEKPKKKRATKKRKFNKKPSEREFSVDLLENLPKGYKEFLWGCTVEQLRKKLELNDQIKAGNKQTLVLRIADRFLNGSLPRCPECSGGYLKESEKEEFYCPGSYDDTEFISCKYKTTTIERTKWKTAGKDKI